MIYMPESLCLIQHSIGLDCHYWYAACTIYADENMKYSRFARNCLFFLKSVSASCSAFHFIHYSYPYFSHAYTTDYQANT